MLSHYFMSRLLILLMMLVFGSAQATAGPLVLCRHGDPAAHAAALESSDPAAAGGAHREVASAAVAEKQGSRADAASAAFGQALPPASLIAPDPGSGRSIAPGTAPASPLAGRTIAPPLDPPLA